MADDNTHPWPRGTMVRISDCWERDPMKGLTGTIGMWLTPSGYETEDPDEVTGYAIDLDDTPAARAAVTGTGLAGWTFAAEEITLLHGEVTP